MKRDFVVAIATLLAMLYFLYFYFANEEINAGSLGTLGDFIGGNINPLLTFASTVLLIETLALQRQATKAAEESAADAKRTVKEQSLLIRTQIFEGSFFNLINLCLDEFKSCRIEISGEVLSGAKAFDYMEGVFLSRKSRGEDPVLVVGEIDEAYGEIVYSSIKSFSAAFGFINESAPDGRIEHYVSLATKLMPVQMLYFLCIARIHTDWPVLKPFELAGFFDKKGICDLLEGYR